MRIVTVSVTARGRQLAGRLPWESRHGRAGERIRELWGEVDALVLFLATGAAVRILAPLLTDKATDPAVVCVDEAGRYAIALCGGHAGGANDLAREVAGLLGAEPVVTTATDAAGLAALDTIPGWTAVGDVAGVSAALLDGRAAVLRSEVPGWDPPPGLAGTDRDAGPSDAGPSDAGPSDAGPSDAGRRDAGPSDAGTPEVLVSDRAATPGPGRVVLHPPSLVVGVGCSTDATAGDARQILTEVLAAAGLAGASVATVATVDRRLGHPAVAAIAEALGAPVRAWTPGELAAVTVPNPSHVVDAAVGTPSVAEAAALLAAGAQPTPGARPATGPGAPNPAGTQPAANDPGAPDPAAGPPDPAAGAPDRAPVASPHLVVPKQTSPRITLAVARRGSPPGRVTLVGLGPGGPAHRTPAAAAAVRTAGTVIGYGPYVDQAADLLGPRQTVVRSPIGSETQRAADALDRAAAGGAVALVCSGDAGVYAMASLVLELAPAHAPGVEVEVVPGVTAALAASALLGAPLGHDHVLISLSDLLTPWEVIARRVEAAADADLVVALYNPRSAGRTWQLDAALGILASRRSPDTPVGVVTDAGRPAERVLTTTLAGLDRAVVGMTTCVIVGSTTTRVLGGRLVTPRGYRT